MWGSALKKGHAARRMATMLDGQQEDRDPILESVEVWAHADAALQSERRRVAAGGGAYDHVHSLQLQRTVEKARLFAEDASMRRSPPSAGSMSSAEELSPLNARIEDSERTISEVQHLIDERRLQMGDSEAAQYAHRSLCSTHQDLLDSRARIVADHKRRALSMTATDQLTTG
jgi:hypothetical protein